MSLYFSDRNQIEFFNALLKKAGFSPSERRIYILGSKYNRTTSSQLVKTSKLPRPTVLAALKQLVETGLCIAHPIDGRSNEYQMLPPEHLKPVLRNMIRGIEKTIEEIDQLNAPAGLFSIKQGSTQRDLMGFLELALRCKTRRWNIIAPRNNAISHLPKNDIVYFKKVRSERQIASQTIWEQKYSDQLVDLMELLMRKPRYIPENVQANIPAIILSFDDMLLIAHGTTRPRSILLSSREAVATYNLVFEIAWRNSINN